MGKQIKEVFSDPLRAITAISTFGMSEEIGATARAVNIPGPTVKKIRSIGDQVYVYTGSAIALANVPAALSGGTEGFGAAPTAGGPLPEAAIVSGPSVVTGETGTGELVLVSSPSATPGTSLSHTVLDTTLYAPGDVAGPIVDFGPGTELTTTYPGGAEALTTGQARFELGTALEGGGGGLDFTHPSTNDQSWLKQTAGAAAGTVGGGLFNRFLQKYVTAPLEQLFGLGAPKTEFERSGSSGGGGGVSGAPYLNWLTLLELGALIVFLVLFLKFVIRR